LRQWLGDPAASLYLRQRIFQTKRTGSRPVEEMQMRSTMTAIGAALVAASFAAAPAHAQLAKQAQERVKRERQQEAQGPAGGAVITIGDRKLTITPAAVRQVQELQAAVNANDIATIPAKLAAAKAAATTPDERYVVAKLQLQAAAASKNQAQLIQAMQDVLATGAAPRAEALVLYKNIANAHLEAKRFGEAEAALKQVLVLEPGNLEAQNALSGILAQQGQHGDAIALLQQAMAAARSGGAAPPENLYKRAVAVAYEGKMPQALELSREWVKAYPTSANWRDALNIYQTLTQLDESRKLDLLRLKRASGALNANDYFNYGDIAVRKGFAGEAKAVLDEGLAAKTISRSETSFNQLYALASQRASGDRESLPASPSANATARQTLTTGDAWFGYGDYAKAVQFYRAALAKPGADRDVINLHLGMALARQGDEAGATAALNAAGGQQAQLAEYWRLYLATRG
jgi:tetratricopeptide (TPR) repeat protein